MKVAEVLRQQAALLNAVADIAEKGGDVPLNAVLDRLDRQFPRKKALSAADMGEYWGVSEANARKRMEQPDFPAERCGSRVTVDKLTLALYIARRAG